MVKGDVYQQYKGFIIIQKGSQTEVRKQRGNSYQLISRQRFNTKCDLSLYRAINKSKRIIDKLND